MKQMNLRKNAKATLLALLVLTTALLWITGLGKNEWVWPNLVKNGMTFLRDGYKTFSLEQGDTYGILNNGPNFSLPAGEYELDISVESDAENVIEITASNGARIEPARIAVPAGSWGLREKFTLLDDAENLQIQVRFQAGSVLKLHDIHMSMQCTDRLQMLTLSVIVLCVLYVLERRGYLTAERKRVLILIWAAVLFASVPALRENLNAGHDSEFHRMRLRNAASALSQGHFPVRVGGSMYNGYGSAASVFYPDLFLYIPAAMMLAGGTIQFAMSAMIIGINALTAACMYACAKRIFDSREAGACSAVLYLLASYRLTDVYTRMALGEALAMAVIPLFVLGLWEVVFGDKRRWPLLALGAMAVFMSHMISTVLCALLAACVCVCAARRILREKRTGALISAAALTVLLCVFYLVPLLDYMNGGISMGALNSSVAAGAMAPWELFAANEAMPRDIGAALLLFSVAAAYMAIGREDGRAKTAKVCLALGAAFALMTTNLFPWGILEHRLGFAVNFLQFPWRLLMLVDLLLALAGGYAAMRLTEEESLRHAVPVCVLAVSVLASVSQITGYTAKENAPYRYWLSNSAMIGAYAEYTLPGSDLGRTIHEYEPLATEGIQIEAYEKSGTCVTADVSAQKEGEITLPLFGFDGYRAQLDGQELTWKRGDNNRLTVQLPDGAHGELKIWFAGKGLWRIADAVSLITAAAAAALWLRKRLKGERRPCRQN